ncbi:MAG: DNA repair protein RecN [Pseudobdellovibrionaceae bacterium]
MLLELKVSNFAIIDKLHLQFKAGLNILSGETGAGKSVLLKSLALLMGGKASSDTIRQGSDFATIEGRFDLEKRKDILKQLQESGIDTDENTLVVRRVISASDKSKIYLNGSLSSVHHLRELITPLLEVAGQSAPLIEMTGQHDNRNLLSKSYHLDLLDIYAGLWEDRSQIYHLHSLFKKNQQQLLELKKDSQLKAQRLDFLIYQKDEIENLNLNPEKDTDLDTDLKKVKNASKIEHFVNLAEGSLYSEDSSCLTQIKLILKKASELVTIDPELEKMVVPLGAAQSQIEDVLYSLRQYLNNFEFDAEALETLTARSSEIKKLQKKYGPEVADILQTLENIQKEIHQLENTDNTIDQLEKENAKISSDLYKKSLDLHLRRQNAAKTLSESVNKELLDLNMKGVTFDIQIEKRSEVESTGISDVEFMSQTSAKDSKRPLAKFASGGELSRILLSLKRVVGANQWPRTYLFDEVDAGVSGETAEKVGRKLKAIAKGQQVICVTHLPQVAAYGDSHFYIHKNNNEDSVSMNVIELKKQDRIKEIARLISGETISKTSLAHAEQLLKNIQ